MYFTLLDIRIAWIDALALLWFVLAWFGYDYYANHRYPHTRNLVSITLNMRVNWMRQMLRRENRIMDAALMGNLLNSITFFASTSILILAGLITILGYRNEARDILSDIPLVPVTSNFMWEFKIFLMAFVFVYTFFKFTWSMRLYNYANMFVGSAPLFTKDTHREGMEAYAKRGGELIGNAGRHFNMGLRAYYYGLAVLSWLLHPVLFMLVTAWVVYEVHRREFLSRAVNSLVEIQEQT